MLVMKTDYSKILNKMMLKCEASFLKCDKCEVKYPWYDPHQYDVQTQSHSGTAIDYLHFPQNPPPSRYSKESFTL